MSTLNLFPARVPIGLVQPDGTVLMTPEFVRAMSALFMRVGGPDGMGSDDLAILASAVAQTCAAQSQAIQDVEATMPMDWAAQIASLLAEMDSLRQQVNQIDLERAELAELRKELEGYNLQAGQISSMHSEITELRKSLEGIELQATYRDAFRVDWERPGTIGKLSPNTGSFTVINAGSGAVATPSIYLNTDTATGLYSIGANNWGFAIGGTKLIDFASTLITVTGSVSATSQLRSTVATGTAPMAITSTTKVANLNVDFLNGTTWAAPGAIGGGTPAAGSFTTLTTTDNVTITRASGVPKMTITATTGTNETYLQFINTGGGYYFGVENSAGSWFGATAYAGVVLVPSGKVFQQVVAGTVRTTTSGTGFDVNGALTASGGFGCNGKSAQAAYALGAAATDLASAITLANNLRTMSINNGTGS